jgi:hypothetical protein
MSPEEASVCIRPTAAAAETAFAASVVRITGTAAAAEAPVTALTSIIAAAATAATVVALAPITRGEKS